LENVRQQNNSENKIISGYKTTTLQVC